LGGAAETELPGLEERILTDDNFYQELLIAEDELIDQYLLDTLSESERNRFVSHFLITPDRQEKFRFSKTLKSYVTAGREDEVPYSSAELAPARSDSTHNSAELAPGSGHSTRPPKLAPAGGHSTRKRWFESYFPVTAGRTLSFDAIFGNRLVFTALSLLILATVSVVLINRLSRQTSVSPQDFYVATLTPGLTRDSGETTRIKIPPDKKMVRLELQLESLPGSSQSGSSNNYQSYTAELRSSENSSTILRRDSLRSEVKGNRQVVNLDIPVENLRGGDYHVRLSGVAASGATEPISRYSFRIVN